MFDTLASIALPAAVGIAAIGAYAFARWWSTPDVRALRRAPRHPIASFPEGAPGRIVGVVEVHEGKVLTSPLGQRACVAWSTLVEEEVGRGRQTSWELLASDFDAVSFVVSDGSGRAIVRAAGSSPSPAMRHVDDAGLFKAPSVTLASFVETHGRSAYGSFTNKTLRAQEGVLAVGARVAVLGIGRRTTDGLVIDCLDDGRLLMSDADGALE